MILSNIDNLNKRGNAIITVECDGCHGISDIKYISYTRNGHTDNSFLCKSCKTKKTNLEKYGVENVSQNNSIREKVKKTNLEKFGCEYASQNKDIKNKVKQTNLLNYGVENVFQSDEVKVKSKDAIISKYGVDNISKLESIKDIKRKTNLEKFGCEYASQNKDVKDKVKQTNLLNHGVEYALQSEVIKNKIKETNLDRYCVENVMFLDIFKDKVKQTNLEKYGVEYTYQNESVKEKIKKSLIDRYGFNSIYKNENFRKNRFLISNNTNYIRYIKYSISSFNCDKCLHEFELSSDNYYHRNKNGISLCTICNPIGDSKSIKEKDIFEYIKSIYSGEIIQSYRDKLEIDIYLPELKIGFEFNGLYWHSDKYKEKNYHLDKTNYFKDKGIRIIHIWEDDWTFKTNIVKSQILNLLGKSYRIFARKCIIKKVDVKTTRKFLDDNHIQGLVNSSIKLGLYYQDELVSIMTFDSFEGRKKMEDGGYNLSRFCNKLGNNVVGGASKLLNYFIKNYDVKRIVSYADKDWSIGNLYYTLGFENVGGNGPDYKYIVDNKRVHKSNYKKSRLRTILTSESDYLLTEHQATKKLGIYRIYDCGKIKFEYTKKTLFI